MRWRRAPQPFVAFVNTAPFSTWRSECSWRSTSRQPSSRFLTKMSANCSSSATARATPWLCLALLATAALLLRGMASPRPRESEVRHIVQVLNLRDGSSVADIGAGSGEVSIAIAKELGPSAKVYSTEIDPGLLQKIRGLAQRTKTKNVIVIAAGTTDTGLEADCCDGIFLREVYHHLTDPISIDRSLYRSLRRGGRLAIIDFDPVPQWPPPQGVPANRRWHGIPASVVTQELTASGFELLEINNWPISATIKHYCLVFRKRPTG